MVIRVLTPFSFPPTFCSYGFAVPTDIHLAFWVNNSKPFLIQPPDDQLTVRLLQLILGSSLCSSGILLPVAADLIMYHHWGDGDASHRTNNRYIVRPVAHTNEIYPISFIREYPYRLCANPTLNISLLPPPLICLYMGSRETLCVLFLVLRVVIWYRPAVPLQAFPLYFSLVVGYSLVKYGKKKSIC